MGAAKTSMPVAHPYKCSLFNYLMMLQTWSHAIYSKHSNNTSQSAGYLSDMGVLEQGRSAHAATDLP